MKISSVILLFFICVFIDGNKYSGNKCSKDEKGNEYCEKEIEEEDEACFYEDPKESLFQWDPVENGYERELELEEGKIYKMITRALRPKIFEIPEFLTEDECEHIMGMAENQGLISSGLHIDQLAKKSRYMIHGRSRSESNVFYKWDKNGDGEITADEVKKFAVATRFLYMDESDVIEMFKNLNISEFDDGKKHSKKENLMIAYDGQCEDFFVRLRSPEASSLRSVLEDVPIMLINPNDSNKDGKITELEFETLNTDGLNEYMKDLRENHPRFRDRFSEQTWLRQGVSADPIMKKIRERVTRLTKLSQRLIAGSEPLQVVHYNVNGHYHAHFDGQSRKQFDHLECCHFIADGKTECRLCRFITILYYLNDVEEGGETAFPVADRENYVHETFQRRSGGDSYNLSKFCHNASVVIAPKRGKAVMWYNHHVDESGWLGERDDHSLHGGCDILKGEKWVANNWITAPEADSYHRTSLYALEDQILSGIEL